MRDRVDFFKIHFDSVDDNNKIEILNLNNIKIAFIDIEIKFNLLKKFQNLSYVKNVLFFNVIINKNIIKICYAKDVQIFF